MRTINILTVKQAAEKLQVSTQSMYQLCRTTDIPVVRVGKLIRIPEDALESWIQNRAQKEETV